MKKNRIFKILVVFSFIIFVGGGAFVYASDCNDGKTKAKQGHNALSMHFSQIDTNEDDTISFEEFKHVFPKTEQNGFNQLDNDKDGVLSHDEWHSFKEMHSGMGTYHGKKYHSKTPGNPSKFNAHFPDIDTDGDDKVTLEEFKAYFPGEANLENVFKSIDLDGKGSLDHDEWHEFKAAHGLKHMD